MSIFISKLTNPYTNLSIGSYFTKKVGKDLPSKVLFLCSSHHGVFIGRNQNFWKECNAKKMKDDNVCTVRRDTGGGACYVDKGNLLFSFIEATKRPEIKKYYPVVINALNSLGLSAKTQGSNDIIIGDKKVSGSAFTCDESTFRHHGTILIDVNKEKLGAYLTPSKAKLQSKGIASVPARICNLTDINPLITVDQVAQEIMKSYRKSTESTSDEIVLTERNIHKYITDTPLYHELFNKYTNSEFIYGKNPDFTNSIKSHRFSFGEVELLLACSKEVINECHIYSDSLDLRFIECIKKSFLNKKYGYDGLAMIQKELEAELGDSYKEKIDEFCKHVAQEL